MRPVISSLQNDRVKNVVKLRDRRARVQQNRFLIEGEREITLALGAGVILSELYVPAEIPRELAKLLTTAIERQVAVFPLSPSVMEKIAYGERRQSVVAVAIPPDVSLPAWEQRMAEQSAAAPQSPLFVVLDRVEKPGNVGAVARSADAVAASGCLLSDPSTDLFNPNTVRAGRGAIFTMPFASVSAAAAKTWLLEHGVKIFSARVDAPLLYTASDFRGPTAFVLGSEAEGLGQEWRGADITPIRLPLLGAADSLNVSVTAAVLLFETLRQRTTAA